MTTILTLPGAFAHIGAPCVRKLFVDQVPELDLQQYFNGQSTLAGGGFTTALFDRKGNVWRELLGGGAAAIVASGIQLTGARYVDLGNIDLSQPFTLAMGLTATRSDPGGTSSVRFMGTAKASTASGSGYYLSHWGNANSPGAGAIGQVFDVATLSGSGGVLTAFPSVLLSNWSAYFTCFSTHMGGGKFRNEIHRNRAIHGQTLQLDLAALTSPGGAVQAIRLGSAIANQLQGAVLMDGFAHYTRAITDSEKAQIASVWTGLAKTRGRVL